MGLGPLQLMESVLVSITRPQTLSLVLIVGLILVMSRIMEENGHMNRLVESFTRLSKDGRTTSSVMSALIGLLRKHPFVNTPSRASKKQFSTTGFGISGNTGGPFTRVWYWQ
jgi:hypothetical protein